MSLPKPIKLSQVDDSDYQGMPPESFVVVGGMPGGGSGPVAISDVTGLQDALDAFDARVTALEGPEA